MKRSLIGLAIGLLISALIAIGIWQTIVIVVMCGAGYLIGKYLDNELDIEEILEQIKKIKKQ